MPIVGDPWPGQFEQPWRGLAISVIGQALDDLRYVAQRADAWRWLRGEDVAFWCDAAGIEPAMVYREAARRLDQYPALARAFR